MFISVTAKQSPKWRFIVTSIDQTDVVWIELESGYASWNLGHLQQKAEIKLRAKTVLDLVSNVSVMDMLRPKLTKLLLKVTAQRSLGLEPDERLIDLGSRNFFLCPKQTTTAARSEADLNISHLAKYKAEIGVDVHSPLTLLLQARAWCAFLLIICEHIKRQHDNYLMKGGQTCFTSVKSCVPDGGLRSLCVDAAMRPHITDRHMQREEFTFVFDPLEDAEQESIKNGTSFKYMNKFRSKDNSNRLQKIEQALDDFVPQKELSAEQTYFPSSFISFENFSSKTKPSMASMPSANPMLVDLNKMENVFKTLFELLEKNSKRES
ncbi:integrase, catalytic region, zinc finger, CCHC-type containing protein [Tanacetum coccineum]